MSTTAPPRPATAAPPRRRRRDDTRLALLFILPASIGLLVFLVWPLLTGLYYSFTEYAILTPPQWVGLENYRTLLADPVFWTSLRVTVVYVLINIGVQTVAALLIAVLMQRLTQSTWLRSLVLAPYLVSNVVAAIVFLWLLDSQLGIVNLALQGLGVDPISFWANESWVIPTIALVNVWRHMGYTALSCCSRGCSRSRSSSTRRPAPRVPGSWRCSAASPCRCCGRSWHWC